MKQKQETTNILENLVTIAIFLVIVQTILEDVANISMWDWNIRKILLISGFVFDLFFTVEFFTRMFSAIARGKGMQYLTAEKGWIDFLASVPLLTLNSGPAMLSLLYGTSVMSSIAGKLKILKVIKIIRIARILRLLRTLKLVKQLKNIQSVMAQHHISRITTLVVSSLLFVMLVFSMLPVLVGIDGPEEEYTQRAISAGSLILENKQSLPEKTLIEFAASREEILMIKENDKPLYTKYPLDIIKKAIGPGDYAYIADKDMHIYFDMRQINVQSSSTSLIMMSSVILTVFFLLFIYAPHFAITVTDPIYVMQKGITDSGYKLAVKIYPRYAEHEVFKLAQAYNEEILPRKIEENTETEMDLSLSDIEDLL
ncbi:ion transporter [Spirochaetia bacterium 38H-sp]|uniref:Ion transporter n=1 Tax=Rarispira pelagica TaxID=3141764 RepID=A0ABU9UBE5_9SPIR